MNLSSSLFRDCVFGITLVFFFFKQKTAYEMRISDWSSDVCSSDLGRRDRLELAIVRQSGGHRHAAPADMLLMRRTRESQRTDVHGFRDKTAHRVDFVIIGGSGGGVSAHDLGPKRGMANIDRDIGADPLDRTSVVRGKGGAVG